ncbi:uncharacterized protein LOC110092541 [Dendrobium catenatum]|uniref:uncharacterized protein LOC110092541 n=1 Tax=Dendrobium catenatum TaxID=906689 RepID=UPI0009F271C1|nr:uncharacterized protein LOC110092541 [Dendrobium catenatum]
MAVWEDISKHRTGDVPLVVGGDFNCIMAKEEKKCGKAFHFNPAANDMASFMMSNDLVDPSYIGPAFTWSNNKDIIRSRIFSRLDRFLLSSSILDSFQGLKVKHLTRLASDHCPILCSFLGEVKMVYSHWIKFEDVRASYPMAWQLVKQKWQNKIKELTQLKEDLDREIKILQEVECSPNGLSEAQAEALGFKCAKVKWIEEGDGNTRFFHSLASARRRAKCIDAIKQGDGTVVTEQKDISKVFYEFFKRKWHG